MEAVEIAMIPIKRRITKEAMVLNLYQLGLLFKLNSLILILLLKDNSFWIPVFTGMTFSFIRW
jgi:hypothetical protein